MKIFKKLAALCMAISLCLGVGALASCGGSDGDSSSSVQQNTDAGYLFKVVNADGSAATGDFAIALCQGTTLCYDTVNVDENGCVLYNADTVEGFPGEGVYDIHIYSGEFFDETEFDGMKQTPATYSDEYIVLTLK